MSTKTAVYPGTFDPLTWGHFDLVERSASIFSHVTVAVAATTGKSTAMFNLEERIAMVKAAVSKFDNVSVEPLDSLLVNFCKQYAQPPVVIRGLRVYSDFEYEFQMALTNRKLAPEIETLFMMPQEEHSYVTASMVREIARYGGDISAFVPPAVVEKIAAHYQQRVTEKSKGDQSSGSGAFDR